MVNLKNRLQLASAVLGLGYVALKITADVRMHRTHSAHSKACVCGPLCYVCVFKGAATGAM